MMGYLFVGLALLCGVTKGYCGKKTSNLVEKTRDAVFFNTVRMLICVFFGFAFCFIIGGKISDFFFSKDMLVISFVSGVANALFVVSWLISVKSSAYMLVDVFLTLSVFVPTVLCLIIYNETISIIQWVGLVVLVVASGFMCKYNSSIKSKLSVKSFILLLFCGIGNGITAFSQKWFVKEYPNSNVSVYNFYSYIFCFVILLCSFFIFNIQKSKNEETKESKTKKIKFSTYIYILVMAICLFLHSFLSTQAGKFLSAVQIYPISQGGSLILSLLMSRLIFKEKINVYCIIGLILTFSALLAINLF